MTFCMLLDFRANTLKFAAPSNRVALQPRSPIEVPRTKLFGENIGDGSDGHSWFCCVQRFAYIEESCVLLRTALKRIAGREVDRQGVLGMLFVMSYLTSYD